MYLSELIDVFEEMNSIPLDGIAPEDDMVLYETISLDDKFCFSLTRQFLDGDFFEYVKSSKAYLAVKDDPIAEIEVYIDET